MQCAGSVIGLRTHVTAMTDATVAPQHARLWVERLVLTGFRNYTSATLTPSPEPIVLIGANGAGKTNLLEAVSLLAPGQGLRGAAFADLARAGTDAWSVAARVHTALGSIDIGTGVQPAPGAPERSGRIVRVDGETRSGSGILADYVEMVWVTPAMDGLFTGAASERRRFLDRLILCFDATYRTRAGRFERAMTSRNRLLADGASAREIEGFELVMAETGVAIAAARAEAVAAIAAVVATRRDRDPQSSFPWSDIAIEGSLERELATRPAVDVEDSYAATLRATRDRDRAAGRTLEGPHRSDLVVGHGPKAMPARLCSTGEQKSLLLGLVLAHAQLVAERRDGLAPILLLDEISAHLDETRRTAMFAEILRLGAQAWMTGTDAAAFSALASSARFYEVEGGRIHDLAVS
jgi:DNA replication and repair protein RecF